MFQSGDILRWTGSDGGFYRQGDLTIVIDVSKNEKLMLLSEDDSGWWFNDAHACFVKIGELK